MLEKLKKKKLLESLKAHHAGSKDSMKEGEKLEEMGESPSFEAKEDENDEQVKMKKKKK